METGGQVGHYTYHILFILWHIYHANWLCFGHIVTVYVFCGLFDIRIQLFTSVIAILYKYIVCLSFYVPYLCCRVLPLCPNSLRKSALWRFSKENGQENLKNERHRLTASLCQEYNT